MPSFINVSDSENLANKILPEACPFCGSTRFWKHGHYLRAGFYRKTDINPPSEEIIQRYLCNSATCQRTFSTLSMNVLPYCRFFLNDFLLLYEKSLEGCTAWSVLKSCLLAHVNLKAIQRLLALFNKVLSLVHKLFREVHGSITGTLGKMIGFLVDRYSWFGFTSRWYHALYPSRLWEKPNPHNLQP